MSTDEDANTSAVNISYQVVKLYVQHIDKWSDAHTETSQCCYAKYQLS